MSDWRTQSVRDLFFYFLFKKEAVTKEQVGEALWPETDDPLILKARFKNEIYRLRRAAGREVIVFDEEYYRFNRALDYEYDVEAFEAHLARARKVKNKEERIEHYQKAVNLVRGPFLVDVDTTWVILERERLEQTFLSALEELAHLYLDANRLEDVLLICDQGLDRDRCREKFHQIAMRAHAAMGDRPGIVRQYQICKTALLKDLGLPPSDETELLYRELAG